MATFVIGRGGPRRQEFREGAIVFRSRLGLPPAVSFLVEGLPSRAPSRALVGHDTVGVPALAARALWPEAALDFHHLDAYVARQVTDHLEAHNVGGVSVHVTADLPAGPYDLVALPLPRSGDALLAREWIEQAHDRLVPGGRLLAATNSDPRWLREAVRKVFGRADPAIHRGRKGGVISARRTREDSREKDHSHEIPVVCRGGDLRLRTRPGVFGYGRLDGGTKALLEVLSLDPGLRTLDLGCGTGALGLAAARETGAEGARLVDSNVRATDLTSENAARNDLAEATVLLRADLEDLGSGPFDLVLANPPYFSDGRIARAFTAVAAARLAPGGRFLLVAKAFRMHREIIAEYFDTVEVQNVRDYGVFTATRPLRS